MFNISIDLPPVVKNLLIINVLAFLGTLAIQSSTGIDLTTYLGLHYISSENFNLFQLISHMFMHGGFMHLFFNMFALWMFGKSLETVWGAKRFLIYYFVCGIGAAFLQLLTYYIRIQMILPEIPQDMVNEVIHNGVNVINSGQNYTDPLLGELNSLINGTMVGASGAVFGLLLGFGMLFPNTIIYLNLFFPVKAKYFVMIYGAIELFSGISANDNIAHFAHLGGMIFGFILIKYWKKNSSDFY